MSTVSAPKQRRFEWDDEEFVLYDDADRWTLGETRAVERHIGQNLNELLMVEQMTAAIAVSIKRQRPSFRISDVDKIEMGVVTAMVEQAEADAKLEAAGSDPTEAEPAAAEPARRGSARSQKQKP